MPRIEVNKSVFNADHKAAMRNRELLAQRGWTAINMIGSPGSGKTTLLLEALPRLKRASAVIAGDVEGSFDADRLSDAGIVAQQVNTHGSCHLSALLVEEALVSLDLPSGALIVIENVGNLVCPAFFDLGENGVLAVLSAAEGHEKPWKYPAVFQRADIVALTKSDLAHAARFDMEAARVGVLAQNPKADVYPLSSVTGSGMEAFLARLEAWR